MDSFKSRARASQSNPFPISENVAVLLKEGPPSTSALIQNNTVGVVAEDMGRANTTVPPLKDIGPGIRYGET